MTKNLKYKNSVTYQLLIYIFIELNKMETTTKYCQLTKTLIFILMNHYITKEQLRILLFDQPETDHAYSYVRKFLSRYVNKGYLQIIDEDTVCPLYRITTTGKYILSKAIQYLFKDGIVANNKTHTLHDITEHISVLYASKRFKIPRNKKHSAAIGNHLATLLQLSSPSLFNCQLEYSTLETTFPLYKAPSNHENIRSDMFYVFTPFLQSANKIQVFFELDTGYQNGNIIFQKLKSYETLFMDNKNLLYRPVLHFSFLFSSYRDITITQDDIARFKKTLQVQKITLRNNTSLKEPIQSIKHTGTHALFSSEPKIKRMLKLIKNTKLFINRREVIMKETIAIPQLTYLAMKGLSIYCSPAKYDDLFLPLLHPESTNGYLDLLDYLNMILIGILEFKTYRPFYHCGHTLLNHDFQYMKLDDECCHIAIEHFSLDLMGSIRIEQFLAYFTSNSYIEPVEPLYLICFFLSEDLHEIRALSKRYQLHTRYREDRNMHAMDGKSEILFVCIEDYFMELPAISFNGNGKGFYKAIRKHRRLLLYELHEHAKAVTEKELIKSFL